MPIGGTANKGDRWQLAAAANDVKAQVDAKKVAEEAESGIKELKTAVDAMVSAIKAMKASSLAIAKSAERVRGIKHLNAEFQFATLKAMDAQLQRLDAFALAPHQPQTTERLEDSTRQFVLDALQRISSTILKRAAKEDAIRVAAIMAASAGDGSAPATTTTDGSAAAATDTSLTDSDDDAEKDGDSYTKPAASKTVIVNGPFGMNGSFSSPPTLYELPQCTIKYTYTPVQIRDLLCSKFDLRPEKGHMYLELIVNEAKKVGRVVLHSDLTDKEAQYEAARAERDVREALKQNMSVFVLRLIFEGRQNRVAVYCFKKEAAASQSAAAPASKSVGSAAASTDK